MEIFMILAPIVGPLLTAGLKYVAPKIPKVLLPLISTIIGGLTATFGGADPITAGALGGSGSAIREVFDQGKKLSDAKAVKDARKR